jgi:hypothetical protein
MSGYTIIDADTHVTKRRRRGPVARRRPCAIESGIGWIPFVLGLADCRGSVPRKILWDNAQRFDKVVALSIADEAKRDL